jgi:membrane protease YdiL (CAAX protease family)
MNLDVLLDPLAIAVLVVFAVLFPWSGVRDYRRLKRWIAENRSDARVHHYNQIIIWEWASVAVFLCWWFWTGRQAAPLGLVPDPAGWQWLTVAIGFVLCAILVLQTISITKKPKMLADMRSNLGDLVHMVPGTPTEQRAFNWLSITAGICEEILYRGLVLAILVAAIGTWPAVFASSIIFGFVHLYQGPRGVAKTAAVGLVLALLTVFSGSVFTAIVVHVIIDLTSGRIMNAAIKLPPEDPAGASAEVHGE